MITLYGIPNCDTVKKARRWLEDRDISYRFHDFRKDGLDAAQIKQWLADLGLDQLINKRSTSWKNLSPDVRESLDEQSAVELILEQPTLIKRPLLDLRGSLHLGFKADTYQALFSQDD